MLSDDDVTALVKDFYTNIVAHEQQARLSSDEPEPEILRQARVEHYRDMADRSRKALAHNAFGTVRMITAASLARRFGIDTKWDKMEVRRVEQAMLRAGIEVAETLCARAEGDFSYEPKDTLLAAALKEVVGTVPIFRRNNPMYAVCSTRRQP